MCIYGTLKRLFRGFWYGYVYGPLWFLWAIVNGHVALALAVTEWAVVFNSFCTVNTSNTS